MLDLNIELGYVVEEKEGKDEDEILFLVEVLEWDELLDLLNIKMVVFGDYMKMIMLLKFEILCYMDKILNEIGFKGFVYIFFFCGS